MEQRIIKLSVKNEYILGEGVVIGAAGSHDEVLLELDFRASPVWHGTTKKAIFYDAMYKNPATILLTTNLLAEGQTDVYYVPVPQAAKTAAGDCFLTVEGTVVEGSGENAKETVRVTTREARFPVLPNKRYLNETPITPTQAEQLQAEIDDIKNTVSEAKGSADAAAESKEKAAASEANAKASEEAAQKSAAAAAKIEETAKAAEAARNSNEQTRQANETSRISAENARNVWESYDASKAYVVGNKVAYGGSSYLCIKPCTGIAPPSAEYWLLIAQKGDKGDKGDKGEPGGGGGQPAVEIDISDSITMDKNCLWTTLLNLSYDSAAAMKIKQAALAGNAKVTVKIKDSFSSEPKRVTLRMVGSQYTDAELGERYNLTGTAVLLGIAPIDVMLGAYGGDPPTHVLGSLSPQQQSEPLAEFDLSDKITLSRDNLFLSSASLGNDKSVGEKIKQAALERRANVTFMLKLGDGDPEKVTLTMLGTQSALNDGTPAYSLTGTYVLAGVFPMYIMIGTILYETHCTVVKRIDSAGDKPIYDPVDKPDTTPDGAFLRWSSEQKKWVAETVPAAEGGSF